MTTPTSESEIVPFESIRAGDIVSALHNDPEVEKILYTDLEVKFISEHRLETTSAISFDKENYSFFLTSRKLNLLPARVGSLVVVGDVLFHRILPDSDSANEWVYPGITDQGIEIISISSSDLSELDWTFA